MTAYHQKLAQEIEQFQAVPNIHALPGIYHYWAGRYLLPAQVELFGTGDVTQIFIDNFLASASAGPARFLSLGAGDCTIEIEIARRLRPVRQDFTIECNELSPALLERARAAAEASGVSANMVFTEVDINRWRAQGTYHAVMAHHSLHHIVELEHVFDEVHAALLPHGRFVVVDMIGRNGHMRWPEAEVLLRGLWQMLPVEKRYNHQLARLEPEFVNWDCSQAGFEGVRAQDILPLMLQRFDFQAFLGFGNLTDVFVDRSFGHNFDAEHADDREWIDRIQAINESLIDVGYLKPTMMMAVAARRGEGDGEVRCHRGWTPVRCVRVATESDAGAATPSVDAAGAAVRVPESDDGAGAAVRVPEIEDGTAAAVAQDSGPGVETTIAQLRAAEEEIERLKAALEAVHQSTSWRILSPLRWLKTRLGNVPPDRGTRSI